MNVRADQPSCGKCGTPLPWDDVDRGFGACKSCGLTFDFSVPASFSMPVAGVAAESPAAPAAQLGPQRILLPLTRIARPSEVQVSESAGGLSIKWNVIGTRERLVVVVAVTSFAISLWSLYSKDPVAAGMFFVIGGVAVFAALRARNAGGGIALRGGVVVSEEGPEVAVANVESFHCEEPTIGKGVSIVANLRDQRTVPLATGIEERAIAVFVTQLLIERVSSSPSMSKN